MVATKNTMLQLMFLTAILQTLLVTASKSANLRGQGVVEVLKSQQGDEVQLANGKRSVDDDEVDLGIKHNERRIIGPVCSGQNGELCCGKKLFRGQFDYGVQCCGNNFYDSATARCCKDKVLLTTDYNVQCCGKVLYDQSKQVCCNGKTYPINVNQQCCDTKIYSTQNQICCNGTLSDIKAKVLSCCVKVAYEPSKSHCINGVVRDKPDASVVTQVCGTQIIDFRKQICCNGQAVSRPAEPTTVCCGTSTISASSQLCCNGSVISNPANEAQCCVKTVFDPNTQVCCNGKVFDRPANSVGTVNYCNTVVNDFAAGAKYSPYFDCCGDQLFTNYDTQLCCVDRLYTYRTSQEKNSYSCCASRAYSTASKTCCQDTLLSAGANLRCCGKKTYDLNKKVCCADTLYNHQSVPADKCCASVQPVINPGGPIIYDK